MAIINGTTGNDFLNGTTETDTINGFDGDDRLNAFSGDDILNGGNGDDTFFPGFGNQTLNGGPGFDTVNFTYLNNGRLSDQSPGVNVDLQAGTASFTAFFPGIPVATTIQYNYTLNSIEAVSGAQGKNVLRAASSGSWLFGSSSEDVLIGGSGADHLDGGLGKDSLTGGAGADIFTFSERGSTAAARDSITDFETGVDRLDLTAIYPTATSLVRVDTGTLVFSQGANGPQTQIGVNGTIQGGDLLLGLDARGAPIGLDMVGQDGQADVLTGSAGADRLFGLSGSDTLNGGAGDDVLFGDAGADVLTGGAGADRFAYRGFADSNAAGGYDIVTDFASGTDKIDLYYLNGVQSVALVRSGGGTFMFAATTGGQVQVGFTGAVQGTDLINPFGSAAAFGYDIVGEAAGETLTGSAGNDRLFGLGGADILNGGAGDDILYGDGQADLLTGGAGADVFAYRNGADSPVASFDKVLDFQSGVDKIDLRAVHTSAADKFGVAYQNGDAFLFLDQGGDGTADMLIVLAGVTNVQAGDILF